MKTIGNIYKLSEDIERIPKRVDEAGRFCGKKGQSVTLVKYDCGLCIVRNEGSDLTYWVDDGQIKPLTT